MRYCNVRILEWITSQGYCKDLKNHSHGVVVQNKCWLIRRNFIFETKKWNMLGIVIFFPSPSGNDEKLVNMNGKIHDSWLSAFIFGVYIDFLHFSNGTQWQFYNTRKTDGSKWLISPFHRTNHYLWLGRVNTLRSDSSWLKFTIFNGFWQLVID